MIKWALPRCGGEEDKARKVIKEVVSTCKIREKRKKVPARSRSDGLMANGPNDVITMDAAELAAPGGPDKIWVARVLDVATKLPKVSPGGARGARRRKSCRGSAVCMGRFVWGAT